jgi:hypothetical protein
MKCASPARVANLLVLFASRTTIRSRGTRRGRRCAAHAAHLVHSTPARYAAKPVQQLLAGLGGTSQRKLLCVEPFLQGCHGPRCRWNAQWGVMGSQPRVASSPYIAMTSDSLTGGRRSD